MANIFSYLAWRGDLDMQQVPFCDVDLLILCRLSYVPFDGVITDVMAPQLSIQETAARILDAAEKSGDEHFFHLDEDATLLRLLTESTRFAGCKLGGYYNIFNADKREQFSAVTVYLPDGNAVCAFRGTDGTVVGWKEDFDLAVSDAVPAQLDAVAYLETLAGSFMGGLLLGGHSKGGNLAVYAAAFCKPAVRDRILCVRNFDGPGFRAEMVASGAFLSVADRTHTILPTSSVVGMLLEHSEDYTVIGSKSLGILQHNPYFWQVERGGFVTVDSRTNSSMFVDDTLKQWIAGMTRQQREQLVDGIFAIVAASEGKTLRDLWTGKSILAILKAAKGIDEPTRALLGDALRILYGSAKSAFPALLDRLRSSDTDDGDTKSVFSAYLDTPSGSKA